MSKETRIDTTASYAIDNDDGGRLLTDIKPVSSNLLGDKVSVVPPTSTTYSLFSENSLFLHQD